MIVHKLLPFATVVKIDSTRRELGGIITAPIEDLDGETCDTEQTWPYYEKVAANMSSATDGRNCLPLREMHQLSAAGKCIHLEKRKDGAIYGVFKVVDDTAWNKVEEGVYTGLSQGGRIVKKWQENGKTFYIADPTECSLCDRPCLEICTFDYVTKTGAVQLRKFAKGVLTMSPDHFLTSAKHHDDLSAVNAKLAKDHNECAELHKKQAEHLRKLATDRSFAELGGGDKAAPSWLKKNYDDYTDGVMDPAGGLRKWRE